MKTSYQYFNAHANGAIHMQMMQCMHDFTSTHTSQREGVRAATTLLINVRCCTGTYRTNSATVSSNAYQREECKCTYCNVCTSCTSQFNNNPQDITSYTSKQSKVKQITSNFRLYDQCENLKIQWSQFKQQSQSVWTTVPRLLAFTEDQERELSMIQRCTTCSQIYFSTKIITLQIKYIEKSIHTFEPNVLTQNTLIQT